MGLPKVESDKSKEMQLDEKDLQILRTVQHDGRLTIKEIARKVHLSTTPVFERLHRLEDEGYIKRYSAVLDAEKLNMGFMVFCNVKLRQMNRDIAMDFIRQISDLPEVTECYNISGNFDYLLKIHVPDMKAYQHFLINALGVIESVGSIESTFVMQEIKQEHGLNF